MTFYGASYASAWRVEKGRYGAEGLKELEAKRSKRKVEEKKKKVLRKNRKIATERVKKG